MMRLLYRFLLALHPREFSRRFGSEMLWIFDQQPSPKLLIDACSRPFVSGSGENRSGSLQAASPGPRSPSGSASKFCFVDRRASRSRLTIRNRARFFFLSIGSILLVTLTAVGCVAWFQFARRLRHA